MLVTAYFGAGALKEGSLMKKLISIVLALAPVAVNASTIAIVDSGTDYRHAKFSAQYLKNSIDHSDNGIDEDKNGYADDVLGWNFAETNNQVIDYSYLGKFSSDVPKFFVVQARILEGTASEEDKTWMKQKRGDAEFIKQLQTFGNFAHGTHVAGITSIPFQGNKVFAAKLIPTEVKMPGQSLGSIFADGTTLRAENAPSDLKEMLLKFGLDKLAAQQSALLVTIGQYLKNRGADVMNGSFGTGFEQAKGIVQALYNMVYKEGERSETQLNELTKYFLNVIITNCKGMVDASPNTLFVFAAGNDGSDNDTVPTSPTNIKAANTISVAATLKNKSLAVFSNYGSKMVEVAAPGVGILSSYPGDEMGLMSGTSQAAPYVTGVAGEIKNQNPKLTPAQMKQILMGTVDGKSWLVGKVTSGGVVNPARAFEAAKLSQTLSVENAIAQAKVNVKDMADPAPTGAGLVDTTPFTAPGTLEEAGVSALPSPIF